MKNKITTAQTGVGDMDVQEFREWAHKVADQVADYLEDLDKRRVLPDIEPGDVRGALPATPPAAPQSMEAILDDYRKWIEPNITHWQHPGFMAYFPSVASGPGILGEWLATGLNSNVMLWRNAPASTELEELVVDWLRQMLGLPDAFDGMLTDTASISSLLSLAAARTSIAGSDIRDKGLAGRPELRRLRAYASAEAHSSIEKAAIMVGIGREGLRRIPADSDYAMDPDALSRAIVEDRAAGWHPFCVVGTLGTTASTGIDPAPALADICARERLWLHLDAAYAGVAAVAAEYRGLLDGWERADSIVVNPHKWMFTPFDASLLLFRDGEAYRSAFSVVPEYLKTQVAGGARNYNEYGVQLGRRFRALKLWMQIRYFGAEGIAARIREHCRMARDLAGWIEAADDWEVLAPYPFALVCFRYRPPGVTDPERIDAINEAILAAVNADGRFFLSHARLNGVFALRVVVGNPRATDRHVRDCWSVLRKAAAAVAG